MLNDEILDDELGGILDNIKSYALDMKKYMEKLYSDTVFMGVATQCFSAETIDSLKLSLRICIKYYMEVEDYIRVSKLTTVLNLIDKPKKVLVDEYILNTLYVNPN